ncbi:MAG: hypothetical protein HWE22_10330 [Flavobacteriales bacterium]|nr:hypothetical protein [Flavobacteriales bacterium]
MNTYKLTFQLKQHTPMIHFQGDQHGATLRATELKPKLDRFIIEQEELTEVRNEKQVPKSGFESWFISKDHLALNYRVKINAGKVTSDEIKRDVDKLPTFFANMGDEYKKSLKYLSKAEHEITLEFYARNEKLRNAISKHISGFLWLHNFGSRQSKGFGSFLLQTDEFQSTHFDVTFELDTTRIRNAPWTNNNSISSENWSLELDLFGALDIFYKSLRSGINRKGRGGVSKFYIKPAIFYFSMLELNQQWDKKSIKEYYFPRDLNKQKIEHNNSDILAFSDDQPTKVLIKDLFGLSSKESWRSYSSEVKKSNSEIDRFTSPVLFKPFNLGNGKYKVGIKCTPIDSDFLGARFDIEMGNSSGLQLTLPDSFSWKDFWNFYFSRLPELSSRLGKNIPNQERTIEYQILSAIDRTINQVS